MYKKIEKTSHVSGQNKLYAKMFFMALWSRKVLLATSILLLGQENWVIIFMPKAYIACKIYEKNKILKNDVNYTVWKPFENDIEDY